MISACSTSTILIFHGYLLRGTGSNVYNAQPRRGVAPRRARGPPVLPGPPARRLDFVDAVGEWDDGRLTVRTLREPVRVHRVPPGHRRALLPVYVADRYEGFEAKHVPRAAPTQELERLPRRERRRRCARSPSASGPTSRSPTTSSWARRSSPARLGRSVPYAVKIHGSALEYTVKPRPDRFLPVRARGPRRAPAACSSARATPPRACGRRWTTRRCRARTRLGPPGVDIAAFRAARPEDAAAGVRRLAARLAAQPATRRRAARLRARHRRGRRGARSGCDPGDDRARRRSSAS